MLIKMFTSPCDGVIACEDASGGEFVLEMDGTIWYQHKDDPKKWFVATDSVAFKRAAGAWNRYTHAVLQSPDDEASVTTLRNDLAALNFLSGQEAPFWLELLEQAESGML